jgi:predicted PurR-regulated permease PerM
VARSHSARSTTSRLVQVAAAIVVIFAMRYAKDVLVPIALAVLFTFLLAPLVHRLERTRIGRVPSVLLVVLLAFIVVAAIGVVVGDQLRDLSRDLPRYTESLEAWIKRIKSHGSAFSHISQTAQRLAHDVAASQPGAATQPAAAAAAALPHVSEVPKVEVVPSTPPAFELLFSTFGPLIEVLATAFIVVVLCIFMLLSREDLRDRVIRLMGQNQINVTTQAMDDAATRVSRYLMMQALTNGSYAIIVAIGLFFIGVPNWLLWGLLAGLLRFIPYVGPWLGAAIPCLLSLLVLGGHRFLITVGMYVALEIIVSSFVEPWLYGNRTGVSSIAILVAAVFWAWVWGGVGLLLATPLTVLLVVVGKYVPHLEFLSVLLGDEPVFDAPTRYYQRLLAGDGEEAAELIEEYAKGMPKDAIFEQVMIPALATAHRDRYRERVDEDRMEFIRESIKEHIEDLAGMAEPQALATPSQVPMSAEVAVAGGAGEGKQSDRAMEQPLRISGAERVPIVCLPARDESDEIAGMMFAQALQHHGFNADAVSVTPLASEMMELVESRGAKIVVISALPPAAVTHARYLCKRLHRRFPDLKLVVGLWTIKAELARARERITCDDAGVVVSTFVEAIQQVGQMVHPLLLTESENGTEEGAEGGSVKGRGAGDVALAR